MLRQSYSIRLALLAALPILGFMAVSARLYYLQVVKHPHYEKLANSQHYKRVPIFPYRGKILDANGSELAGSVNMNTMYLVPKNIEPAARTAFAQDISRTLRIDFDAIMSRIQSGREAPIARRLDAAQRDAVIALMLKKYPTADPKPRYAQGKQLPRAALYFLPEGRRGYTKGTLAAHVVGYTELNDTGDNKGVAGIERTFDNDLAGTVTYVRARKNAKDFMMEPVDGEKLEESYGHNVVLTIDERIQLATERALARGVQYNKADSGVAVVMNVKTGEILALANVPTFDLNHVAGSLDIQRRNRAITDAIEPGSVMKIFTFASLYDEGKLNSMEMVACHGGRWNIGSRTITDAGGHGMGTVTARDVFKNSSNVGTVKLAMNRLAPNIFYHRLHNLLGFGDRSGIELPGESRGMLNPVKSWSGLSMSSIPMGYEVQTNAVQVAAAVAAIANKGIYMQPHIVREIRNYRNEIVRSYQPKALRRVVNENTTRNMMDIMEAVVTEGTGKGAALDLYRVAGKTGTTKKLDPVTRRYESAYIASFAGVAPVEDPEICIYVYVDNPDKSVNFYGGAVSAPIFREIADATLRTLRVPVSANIPTTNTLQKRRENIRMELSSVLPEELLKDRMENDATTGTMPNLTGKSLREAVTLLAEYGIEAQATGAGVVVDQKPRAYETLEGNAKAQLVLIPEAEFIQRRAAEIKARAEAPLPSDEPTEPETPVMTTEAPALRIQTRDGKSASFQLIANRPATTRRSELVARAQDPVESQSQAAGRPSDADTANWANTSTRTPRSVSTETRAKGTGSSNSWERWDKERQATTAQRRPATSASRNRD